MYNYQKSINKNINSNLIIKLIKKSIKGDKFNAWGRSLLESKSLIGKNHKLQNNVQFM